MPGAAFPTTGAFDETLGLLREGYTFISNRCDQLGSDAFRTRLMLRPAICFRGPEAAEMFYASGQVDRSGAMPPTTLRLLQDKGSVQTLENDMHRVRKGLFVSLLMTDEAERSLVQQFRQTWRQDARDWRNAQRLELFGAVNLTLTRTVLAWAGLPGIPDRTDTDICRVLSAMIENAGHVGPATIVAMMRRSALEKRLRRVVRAAREGKASSREGSPFDRILAHRDADGEPLDDETAVVELLNILRPVVAIGRYIVFTALALHQHPRQEAALKGADGARYEAFAEEVRRLYPFEEGEIDTTFLISHRLPLEEAPAGYKNFHDNQNEWTKVVLKAN